MPNTTTSHMMQEQAGNEARACAGSVVTGPKIRLKNPSILCTIRRASYGLTMTLIAPVSSL